MPHKTDTHEKIEQHARVHTLGVWPFTLPARASEPCTFPPGSETSSVRRTGASDRPEAATRSAKSKRPVSLPFAPSRGRPARSSSCCDTGTPSNALRRRCKYKNLARLTMENFNASIGYNNIHVKMLKFQRILNNKIYM